MPTTHTPPAGTECDHCQTELTPTAVVNPDDPMWLWRTPSEWRWFCNQDCLDNAAEAAAMRMGY